MSLLQQDSPSGTDGRGEELTKGTGHPVIATVLSAVIVTIVIAGYVIGSQKPPAFTGEASRVVAHMMHRETSGFDASGAVMPKEEFDQVLVFSHLKLHNQSKDPLFLHQVLTNIVMDNATRSSYAAIPADYERLFAAYPDLAALHGKPLPQEATIAPGQDLEGDIVSSFRMTKAEFDSRKGLDFTVSFRYQPDLKITPVGAVAEQ